MMPERSPGTQIPLEDVASGAIFGDAAAPGGQENNGAPTAPLPHKRDVHIDVMKGIGMLLVLISHMNTLDYLGYSILGYGALFMMPMFFFINGYLFPFSSEETMRFGKYARRKLASLWGAYTVFFLLSLLWTETVYAVATGGGLFGFALDWKQLVLSYFLAGQYLFELALVPFPIWFLHALFFASLVFYFIVKIKSKVIIAAIALALSFAALPLQQLMQDSPLWLVRMFPLVLFYMLVGYLFRRFFASEMGAGAYRVLHARMEGNEKLVGGFLSLLCLLAGLYCMRFGGGDMWNIASYWHVPGALVSILGCYLFAKCTDNRILQYVGIYSMLYLGLHPMIVKLPAVSSLPDWFAAQGFDGIVVYIGYFVVAFLLVTVLVTLAALVQGAFRSLLRRRRARRAQASER